MFTGIVDHCGEIISREGISVKIKTHFKDLKLGESIAIDGICLTVTETSSDYFCCEVSPETDRLTTSKNFKIKNKVNLERALLATDRLGGHIVMGHVDTMTYLSSKEQQGDFWKMRFSGIDKNGLSYFVKKGSVAVNGVSLTINEVCKDGFEVMLIPHTLLRTNLGNLEVNNSVNIEYDYFARYMINYLEQIGVKND
jgi:riboflavin synthase